MAAALLLPLIALELGHPSLAAAQLDMTVETEFPAPIFQGFYKRFGRVSASDASGQAVVFVGTARRFGTKKQQGVFAEDLFTAANPGSVVILRDEPAPSGKFFRRLSPPYANSSGLITWQARLTGGQQGVFMTGPVNVALAGDTYPGGVGALETFWRPIPTDANEIVFHAGVQDGPIVGGLPVKQAILRCSGGDLNCSDGTGVLSVVAQTGDSAGGRSICNIGPETFSASTYGVAFRAFTQVDCSDALEAPVDTVYRKAFGGSLQLLALQGAASNPTPIPGGTTYQRFKGGPAIQNAGSVAFLGATTGATSDEIVYRCLIGSCPASLPQALLRNGDADIFGNTVSRFESVGIGNANDVSFWAKARHPSIGSRGAGIFVRFNGSGDLTPIALKDESVPNSNSPSTFRRIHRRTSMSPGGRVAFQAKIRRLNGGGASGLYVFQ